MFGIFETGRKEATHLIGKFNLIDNVTAGRRSGKLVQNRLEIKQVNLTGASIHEKLNHRLSLRMEMGRPGLQIVNRPPFLRAGRQGGVRREQIAAEKPGESCAMETVAESREEVSPG